MKMRNNRFGQEMRSSRRVSEQKREKTEAEKHEAM